MEFGTVGAPRELVDNGDFRALFTALKEAGVTQFMPMSLFEETPVPVGSGYEAAFFPPPYGAATSELYDALRESGLKLVLSAELMYPQGAAMPSLQDDPLAALLRVAGPDIVGAVYGYDEAALHGVDPALSQAVYERVKAISPEISVLQVHASMPEGVATETYLQSVRAHMQWADDVGFAVYPYGPKPGALSPYSGATTVSPVQALKEYASWLEAEFPEKGHIGVLQGFGFADLYSDDLLAQADPALVAAAQGPGATQIAEMIGALSGMDTLFWYGPSYLDTADNPLWRNALSATQAATAPLNKPIGELEDVSAAANAVSEDAAPGAEIGLILRALDPDSGDSVTYSLDDARFSVSADGVVRLAARDALDFETEHVITLTATATSSDGSVSTASYLIAVEDAQDILTGDAGSNTLLGGVGGDMILGHGGADLIGGGSGDDVLDGGAGSDHLLGGAGRDSFRFRAGDGEDMVLDFTVGEDKLEMVGMSWSDLSFHAFSEGGAIIYAGGVVHLAGVNVLSLGMDDFLFV